MVEFDELRELWQRQAQPDTAAALDGAAMADVLRRFHRKQTIINCLRASLLLFLALYAAFNTRLGFVNLCGVFFLVIGMTIFLAIDWRNQISIARLDFTKPSADFVESSIQRLHDMRYPFRRTFWLFIISAVVGLNLISWHPGHTLARTILTHVNATAFPFVAFWLGAAIRAKRFDMQCRPIMEKLIAMKRALRESAR